MSRLIAFTMLCSNYNISILIPGSNHHDTSNSFPIFRWFPILCVSSLFLNYNFNLYALSIPSVFFIMFETISRRHFYNVRSGGHFGRHFITPLVECRILRDAYAILRVQTRNATSHISPILRLLSHRFIYLPLLVT